MIQPPTSGRCEVKKDATQPPPIVSKKRAHKKYMSSRIAANLSAKNPHSPLHKSYERSKHCMEILTPSPEADGRLIAHYCKNRWCPVCQSIRTAILINGYGPQIKNMKEPYFVTLTRPTVKANGLPEQIDFMTKTFRRIKSRKKMRNVDMLRKEECTLRPFGYYHFHFHVIVDGKENAEYLLTEWLKLNPESVRRAQDCKPFEKGKEIELFKYFTKLIAKDKNNKTCRLDYRRLDVVFLALRGRRTFQNYGNVRAVNEEINDEDLKATRDVAKQAYMWITNDWVGMEEGDLLTGYKPNDTIKSLMDGEDVPMTEDQLKKLDEDPPPE